MEKEYWKKYNGWGITIEGDGKFRAVREGEKSLWADDWKTLQKKLDKIHFKRQDGYIRSPQFNNDRIIPCTKTSETDFGKYRVSYKAMDSFSNEYENRWTTVTPKQFIPKTPENEKVIAEYNKLMDELYAFEKKIKEQAKELEDKLQRAK